MKNKWIKRMIWAVAGCIAVYLFLDYSGQFRKDHIVLSENGINKVSMRDSLWVEAFTCRGCAYEHSTSFDVDDPARLVKLVSIKTANDKSTNTDGGSINKTLILVPTRTGKTTLKVYRFYDTKQQQDSSDFKSYDIEIKK